MMLLLTLLLACPGPTSKDDLDGDGVPDTEDCASDDPSIFPGAADICDGVDNNCDGALDEDAQFNTYFRDQDNDSYGDPAQSLSACERPRGYVKDDSDCGPADATIYPGAAEFCDGTDHDCDGSVNDPDAVDPTNWYPDQDHDGFGDPRIPPVSICVGPNGYVGNANDCDDTDPLISPRAAEVCDPDDVDENCNGLSDQFDEFAAGGQQAFPDADQDGFGDDHSEPIWVCELAAGYTSNDADCDDTRALVKPGGVEICNGLDDDCDGGTDLDATDASTWYLDRDEDNFGDPASTVLSCGPVDGYVLYGGDCDDRNNQFHPSADESSCGDIDYNCDGYVGTEDHDGDGYMACLDCNDGVNSIFPGAEEICDGVDDNCDGIVDLDSVNAVIWYADQDLDGYGDPNVTQLACEQPYLYVSSAGDCDDHQSATHPGALEDCATPDDDDCDGNHNEVNALNCVDWYADADQDGYGSTSACVCEPTVDYSGEQGGDCDDSDAGINPGAPEYCTSVDTDCDGKKGPCDVTVASTIVDGVFSPGKFGDSLGVGDVTGDGQADLVVGASVLDGLDVRAGGIYVFSGIPAGRANANSNFATFLGERSGDKAGEAMVVADLDQNGLAEIYVGTSGSNKAGNSSGVVYVVEGVSNGQTPLTNANGGLVGEGQGDMLGEHLALVGDMDGDGFEEIGVGARFANRSDTDSGAVYLFGPGAASGLVSIGTSPTVVEGAPQGARLSVVSRAGDVDGDGAPELLVGAPVGGGNGMAWLMGGKVTGVLNVADGLEEYDGLASGDELGAALAPAGDQNQDGYDDFWVAASGGDVVYGLHGSATGTTSLSQAAVVVRGAATGDSFGYALCGDMDLDGDGREELVVAAPGAKGSKTGSGVLYVFPQLSSGSWGTSYAVLSIPGEATNDGLGESLVGIPDLTGDGQDEIGVGAVSHTVGGNEVGTAYLLSGNNLL